MRTATIIKIITTAIADAIPKLLYLNAVSIVKMEKVLEAPPGPPAVNDIWDIEHLKASVDHVKDHEIKDCTDRRNLDIAQALPAILHRLLQLPR